MSMDGALIVESLRVGATLTVPLRVRALSRFRVADATPEQPPVWTLLEFEADDTYADELASALSAALGEIGWYANFQTWSTLYVVFAGRVFAYARGDEAADREAREYARSVGVPETQLDWGS